MIYPCGIIKDLLPIYIDDVCNEESKQAVENHLLACEECRNCYEVMKSTDGFVKITNDNSEDTKMANSLKNVKHKINKKIRGIIWCAVAAVLVFVGGYFLLFNAAIKNVPLEDVSFSADVYSLVELIDNPSGTAPDSESVIIYSDENDSSEVKEVIIPNFGKLSLTEEALDKCKYVTAISVNSEYYLKTTKSEVKGDTMYITAIKTTLLNSKVSTFNQRTLELQEINKIVYINDDGTETVLWMRES